MVVVGVGVEEQGKTMARARQEHGKSMARTWQEHGTNMARALEMSDHMGHNFTWTVAISGQASGRSPLSPLAARDRLASAPANSDTSPDLVLEPPYCTVVPHHLVPGTSWHLMGTPAVASSSEWDLRCGRAPEGQECSGSTQRGLIICWEACFGHDEFSEGSVSK
jgi:hypothetical protein